MTTDPIFVVGFQRSGTTLLQSLLGAHSRIAATPEIYFINRVVHRRHHWPDLADDGDLRKLLRVLVHPRIDLLANAGFDEDVLFERLEGRPRTFREILSVMMEDFAVRAGKPRWSEKSPGQPAGEVLKLFPEARLVHIVRHPLDVLASSLGAPWNQDPLSVLAERWRRSTQEALEAGRRVGSAQYLRISYEELATDPPGTMRRVCEHVGESFEPRMVDDVQLRGSAVSSVPGAMQDDVLSLISPPRDRRSSLSRVARYRLWRQLGGVGAALGYPAPGGGARQLGWLADAVSLQERRTLRHWLAQQDLARANPVEGQRLLDEFLNSRGPAS